VLLKVEASAVVHQPHIALMIEGIRQSYNHRDYLYDVGKELISNKPADQKLSNIRDRTAEEIKAEGVTRLASGGATAVSSQLKDLGVFRRPFGLRGPELNEQQSRAMQFFFEGTLSQLIEERISA
jgi:hypothetical protein